jgi:hypothetical protein
LNHFYIYQLIHIFFEFILLLFFIVVEWDVIKKRLAFCDENDDDLWGCFLEIQGLGRENGSNSEGMNFRIVIIWHFFVFD